MRALLLPLHNNPRPSSVVGLLLYQLIVLSQSLNRNHGADRRVPIIAWYGRGDDDGWTFLLALLVASAPVEETRCQGDEVYSEDDNDRDADGICPVEAFVLLILMSTDLSLRIAISYLLDFPWWRDSPMLFHAISPHPKGVQVATCQVFRRPHTRATIHTLCKHLVRPKVR